MALLSVPSLISGKKGWGGGGLASRLVLERETHNLGQNRQKPLTTPYLKIKDRKTACFDLPIAPSPEGDKLKEEDFGVSFYSIQGYGALGAG